MSFEILTLYIIAIFIVIMIPGPLSLFMVSNSVQYGIVKSYPAFLGGTVASSLYLIISATGLGALLIASGKLFFILKIAGALYLIYLGVAAIQKARKTRARMSTTQPIVEVELTEVADFRTLFTKAFLLGAGNPKDIIFFMAFLPQFISADNHLTRQIIIIVAVWIVVDLICKIIYGLLAKFIKPWLTTSTSIARFEKSTGGLYIVAGVAAIAAV